MTTPISRHEQKLHRQLLLAQIPSPKHAGLYCLYLLHGTFSCWGHHIGRIMRAHLAGIMTGSLSLSLSVMCLPLLSFLRHVLGRHASSFITKAYLSGPGSSPSQ